MFRPSFIPAFALAVIVTLPTLASADECACLPAEMAIVRGPRIFQSVEVGPLFSSDGATLTSAEARDFVRWMGRERRGPTQVNVCVSPNDPRCSPRDSTPDHGPQMADGARYVSSHARTRSDRPPLAVSALRPLEIHGARSGVRARLERPPRA